MSQTLHRFSTASVERHKKPGMYHDGGGLYLQVAGGGTKSWVLRFRLDGRTREMGLGSARIGLAKARARAADGRRLCMDGIDPIEDRKAKRDARRLSGKDGMTFAKCAAAYIEAHRPGWRNAKHADQWTSTLATYCEPVFGNKPVQAIDLDLVLEALKPIWTSKPETAGRVRGRIESVLDWAKVRGHRTGENPARWRGHLDKVLPARAKVRKVEHHPALPYSELPSFMRTLRNEEGTAARALEFLILTAARTGEVIGARWREVDFEEGIWTIPAERMKAGREHRAVLSAPICDVLTKIYDDARGPFLFPGGKAGKPLSNMAILALLKRMRRDNVTAHGFRSTFRDWASEQTSCPGDVAEMALAHTVSDKVEAAYRRGDLLQKRKQLMEDWANYCIGKSKLRTVMPSELTRQTGSQRQKQ